MEVDATMSREIITAEMAGAETHLIGVTILSGEDRPTIRNVYEPDGKTVTKSLRLPTELAVRADAVEHPNGFSGLVREALEAYLQPPAKDDAENALRVLSQLVAERRAA
jgi:predicted DNA-binding protein